MLLSNAFLVKQAFLNCPTYSTVVSSPSTTGNSCTRFLCCFGLLSGWSTCSSSCDSSKRSPSSNDVSYKPISCISCVSSCSCSLPASTSSLVCTRYFTVLLSYRHRLQKEKLGETRICALHQMRITTKHDGPVFVSLRLVQCLMAPSILGLNLESKKKRMLHRHGSSEKLWPSKIVTQLLLCVPAVALQVLAPLPRFQPKRDQCLELGLRRSMTNPLAREIDGQSKNGTPKVCPQRDFHDMACFKAIPLGKFALGTVLLPPWGPCNSGL